MSEHGEIELAKTLGIGDRLDGGDLSLRDAKAEHLVGGTMECGLCGGW